MAVRKKLSTPAEGQESEFEKMSVPELNDVIGQLTILRDSKLDDAKREFIERTRAEAEGLGLAMADLVSSERKPTKPAVVKYRHGNETWSGRGRLPNWLAALEAEGHNRSEYAV